MAPSNPELERLREENKRLKRWLGRVFAVLADRPVDSKAMDPECQSKWPAGFLMPPITRAKHPSSEQLQDILDEAYVEGLLP